MGALFAPPPPQAPPSGVKGSVEQNLMSFLGLPWLKTYKLIYIMKIENLDKSAPIRHGGACKLLCVSLAIPVLKYVIKTAYTINIIEKSWENA